MSTLLEHFYAGKEKTGTPPNTTLENQKTAYTELLKKEKILEAYLDNLSVPFEMREAKIGEFKDILRQLNQLLIEIIQAGHHLKSEEVLKGFDSNSY